MVRNVHRQQVLFCSLRLFTNFICYFTLINYISCCTINFVLISINLIISLLVTIPGIEWYHGTTTNVFSVKFFEKRNHEFIHGCIDTTFRCDGSRSKMEMIQIKPTAITRVATGSRQVRKDREVISGIYQPRMRKREKHGAREKDIYRFLVPFRYSAGLPVTMPWSNCSLFFDRTLPRRSTRR